MTMRLFLPHCRAALHEMILGDQMLALSVVGTFRIVYTFYIPICYNITNGTTDLWHRRERVGQSHVTTNHVRHQT